MIFYNHQPEIKDQQIWNPFSTTYLKYKHYLEKPCNCS